MENTQWSGDGHNGHVVIFLSKHLKIEYVMPGDTFHCLARENIGEVMWTGCSQFYFFHFDC